MEVHRTRAFAFPASRDANRCARVAELSGRQRKSRTDHRQLLTVRVGSLGNTIPFAFTMANASRRGARRVRTGLLNADGDILPLSKPTRTMAALEAVTGQLYLAVVIAHLVGLRISQSVRGADRQA